MISKIAGRSGATSRRRRWEALLCAGLITPAILMAAGVGKAEAGQLPASDFTAYDPSDASSIVAGPTALYTVDVDSLHPTQENEGLTEVGKKTAGFDLDTPGAGLTDDLLTDIEPVVIGPGGVLYLTDGHHTFTALEDSTYGASDPTVYVNVIANYSNLTMTQFVSTMESNNLLLPIDDGVFTQVNPTTLAPIPSTLTGLTSDPYRGLEYSILKNKSSTLFPTTDNITGKVGASTPGLDKMTGFYSDFLEADAYRGANGGLGLPYLSPGDIAIATDWNLNPDSTTTLPNISGTVTAAQLPGFILSQSIVNAGGITDATLANGAMDGNGTFTGITSINVGTVSEPITIGTPNVGFIMQLGADSSHTVTLEGTNSYTGGTSILAGHLIVQSDASLGAATPTSATINPNSVLSSVQAANGIIFNSLSEGDGTLTLGTTTGGTFTTDRPIAVGGESATIDVNDNTVTLTGQLASLGTDGVGIGNAYGESDLTIDDLSSQDAGKLILSTPSPYFYGNIIIGNTGVPTVEVMSDAALGATSATAPSPILIGEVELNGGTLQAGASFDASDRNLFLGGGSQIDVNGFDTTWGTVTDVQRTLEILNSNTTTQGQITFNALDISATAILQTAGGAAGETVTFTNGIDRTGADTLILNPSSSTALGTTEQVFSSGASITLTDGIAPAWIVTTSASKGVGPYDFVTYGGDGYVAATYNANTTTLNGTTGSEVVKLSASDTLSGSASVYALNTNGKNVTVGSGNTLTIGDGTAADAAGLILASGTTISGGALAFGGSQGVIWLGGGTPTISSVISGGDGLIFAGSGAVNLSAQEAVTGAITIDSGTVNLTGTNVFATDTAGILMDNVKSHPAAATLGVSANNTIASIVQVGNNSEITLSSGASLTLGDTTNNESSTIVGEVKESGAATAGALTLDGSGVFDFSGVGKSDLDLVSGSSVIVNNSAQFRVVANEFKAGTTVVLNGTSQLQFEQNEGGVFANTVSGTGELHLIGGILQITGTSNTYSGGTVVETGSTLDITTNNLPAINPNITDAGGLIVFDQNFTGTYSGVISDGLEMGTGPLLSGSLDKDDSTDANGSGTGNLILANVQAYTGETYIEAGTITLDAVDTIADSSGVDLGRVGGGSDATLALGADNTIKALSSEADNTTSVTVGSYTLTIDSPLGGSSLYSGSVTGSGALVMEGSGVQGFGGAINLASATVNSGTLVLTSGGSFTGNTVTVSGGELDVSGGAIDATTATVDGGTLELDSGTIDPLTVTVTSGGLVVTGGTLTAATLNTQGGTSEFTGGTIDADQVNQSGGLLEIAGGALSATDVSVSGGTLELTSGSATASGSTTVSSGALQMDGGSYSTGDATVSGGYLEVFGGTFGSGDTTVSGGDLVVDGGAATVTALTLSSGEAEVTSGTLGADATTVSGGEVLVDGGAFSASSVSIDGGAVETTAGSASISGSTTVSSGYLVVDGGSYSTHGLGVSGAGEVFVDAGALDAGATTVSGGSVLVDGGAFSASSVSISGGEFEITSGTATVSGSTTVSNGELVVDGGSYSTDGLGVSGTAEVFAESGSLSGGATTVTGGVLTVDGGGFSATSASLTGGEIDLDGGSATISGATAVSGGSLVVAGGTYSTDGLNVSGTGGLIAEGGVVDAGATTVSGGLVLVEGGTFNASSVAITGGELAVAFGSASVSGATSVTGGELAVDGKSYVTDGLDVEGGLVDVDGGELTDSSLSLSSGEVDVRSGTLNGGAVTVSGGTLLVDGGVFTDTSLDVTGGSLEIDSGSATLSSLDLTSGSFVASGGSFTIGDATIDGGALDVTGGTVTATTLSLGSGDVEVTGGTLDAGSATVSGGMLLVDGGAFDASSTSISGGVVEMESGTAAITGSTTVSGGDLAVGGGTFTTAKLGVSGGAVTVSGGTLNGGAATVSAGSLLVDGGAYAASSTAISGGEFEITSGSAVTSGATTVSGGALAVDGGTYTTDDLTVGGGGVDVAGGDLEATTAEVTGGVLELDSGAIDPLTVSVSSGKYLMTGGTLTAAALDVSGGLAELSGGTANVTDVGVSGGILAVTGTTLEASDVAVSGGEMQQTGGSTTTTTTEVSGGSLLVAAAPYATTAMTISAGTVGLSGGTFNGGATTLTGGQLIVAGGAFSAASTTVDGGVVDVQAPDAFTSTVVTVGPNGTFQDQGGSNVAGIATFNNSGVLDIRGSGAGNVFTIGAYDGSPGSELVLGADLPKGMADRLAVASATGSTQVVVTQVNGSGGALAYNPTGIPVVTSASAMSPTTFTLAAPVQGGLFQYDLAYNAAGQDFVLIGTPTADAYRLATLPTAAQSIWFDTASSLQDHQSDLRAAGDSTPADGSSGAPGVWARAVGAWGDRSQTGSYTDLNKSYTFQSGYNQTTGGFFGGFDKDAQVAGGEFIAGFGGGYITSNQDFKLSPSTVTYQGPSLEASAAYMVHGLFLDASVKADFLSVAFSAPTLGNFGNPRPNSSLTSYGAVGDAGYRWSFGQAYLEPIASLAYVESEIDTLHLAGTNDSFGDNDQLRGRLGLSGGATLLQDSHSLIQGALTASYWDRLSGGSEATIASAPDAPLLTLFDDQLRSYGEVGVSLSADSLKTGWSGFIKADYQFGTGFTGEDVKAGIRFRF
jgi:autotransporter-associated beta strand protein